MQSDYREELEIINSLQKNQEDESNFENDIPDLPENEKARNFLKIAPKTGLHVPLGKEVKVMQCFRCRAYGHRANDRECPLLKQGNVVLDSERQAREDPMSQFVATKLKLRQEKYERVEQLKLLLVEIRQEEAERKKRKAEKKEKKDKKKKKHKHEK